MSKKVETHFDESAFEEWSKRMMKHAQNFCEAITALQAEGIDVSVKSISEYPVKFAGLAEGEPRKYNNHFRELYKQAEAKAGWLPKNELDRMYKSFVAVCNKTINHAEKICIALNFGLVLTDDKGVAVPDTDATEQAHKKDFTYTIDADAMAEHWRLLNDARKALDTVKKWEAAHGLPPINYDHDYYSFGAFINRRQYDGKEATMSEQEHNNRIWQYFKISDK